MNKLWSVPIITVYLYGVTILTNYGYYSYFNIPSSFIEVSIKENVIYFYQLFTLASSVAGYMRWWMVFIVGVVTLVFYFFYFFTRFRLYVVIVGALIFTSLLIRSFTFGQVLGKSIPNFYVPSQNCFGINSTTNYAIPSFYDGKAIFVEFDNDLKLKGNVFVKNLSDINCSISIKNIGALKK